MSDIQEYPDVVQEIRGALNPGRLKLQRNSIIFKNNKTGKVDQFQSSEVEKSQWLKRARGHCLKLVLKGGNIHRYDGFKEPDYDRISKFLQDFYEMPLERVDMSIKGWNWGLARFEGNSLNFELDKSLVFDIPLTNVSHTTTSKNEVTLEFHQNDDAAVNLMEVRFHIPTDNSNPESDPVQEFYKQVMDCADIIQATGDAIVTLSEVQCLTPRGRYDIKMYPSFLQLHGKTFDYKIPYTTILRLFLLPHKDSRQMFFVVSLDPPIKQGQTRYHFLILLFNKEDEMSVELGISEEDLKQKYDDQLQVEMSGLEYELVSRIFKVITQRKITVPGSFIGHSGTQAISCSYKAATGLLYPLERGFIFVHKPPLHIRFDEIVAVNFARSAGTRSFDFDVETKSGTMYNFVGIEKDEYGKLYDFVSGKKLRVKNIGGTSDKSATNYEEMSDSDEDKGDHDAYLEKMKREGKQKDDDDSDDDSSDESFNPGDSGSEVAEEYDSNPPTTSSGDSDSDYSAGSAGSESDNSAAEERREKERERKQQKKEKEKREKKEKKSKSAKTVREGPQKKRKSKKKKDPNVPKRPQSAFFLWLNEHRESIKRDHPGISVTEVTKLAGEMWKELTDKTEWEEKARSCKLEYELAMAEYMEKKKNAPPESDSESDGGKKAKPKAKKASTPRKSPKKAAKSEGGGGGGGDFKSKEFISSDESSSDSDKPLKKKSKKKESEEEAAADSSPAASDAEGKAEASGSEKSMKSEKSDKSGEESAMEASDAASGSDDE